MERAKRRQRMYSREIGLRALRIDILLCLVHETLFHLGILERWFVQEANSEGNEDVVEHRGVVGCLGRFLVSGCIENITHVAEEEGRDDSKTPGKAELEHEIKRSA